MRGHAFGSVRAWGANRAVPTIDLLAKRAGFRASTDNAGHATGAAARTISRPAPDRVAIASLCPAPASELAGHPPDRRSWDTHFLRTPGSMSAERKRSMAEMAGRPRPKGRATGENKLRAKPPRRGRRSRTTNCPSVLGHAELPLIVSTARLSHPPRLVSELISAPST